MRISVSCDDRDNTDAKACSAGSIISIAVSWPEKQNTAQGQVNDARCAFNADPNRACVVKEVTL
ncbi:hypothetical protein [Alteromonas lipolytica]|uniref:hypothetical protein n=1 Tax=Alteromonas lipolytica TaxID=1856405 RepID=UPI0009F6DB2F|nr:hypothetical protein [Alteromonas lipolytica]